MKRILDEMRFKVHPQILFFTMGSTPDDSGSTSTRNRLEAFRGVIDGLRAEGPPQSVIVHRASRVRSSVQTLGIFSASFNPPTSAHLRMIEEADRHCRFDEILLLLAKANVDKRLFGAPLEARLLMLDILARDHPTYSVGAVTHPRFIDKADAVRPHYPRETHPCFIVGYDTLIRLFDPKYYTDMPLELERLFASSRFVAANRGTHGVETIRRFIKRPECRNYAHRIDVIELDPRHAKISSSMVRDRIQRRKPIEDLVPEGVQRLIHKMGLYRSPPNPK